MKKKILFWVPFFLCVGNALAYNQGIALEKKIEKLHAMIAHEKNEYHELLIEKEEILEELEEKSQHIAQLEHLFSDLKKQHASLRHKVTGG